MFSKRVNLNNALKHLLMLSGSYSANSLLDLVNKC